MSGADPPSRRAGHAPGGSALVQPALHDVERLDARECHGLALVLVAHVQGYDQLGHVAHLGQRDVDLQGSDKCGGAWR